MGGTYFPKIQNMDYRRLKRCCFKKFMMPIRIKEKTLLKQKDLIIKNLDLKKNSVLNQDLEPIVDISLNHLDQDKRWL